VADQKTLSILPSGSQEKSSGSDLAQVSWAAERTAILFGCYRSGQANDPEVYTMAVAATLAEYPKEVVQHVTDPRSGLPAKLKFLPSVAEVREACEDHWKFVKARQELIEKGWRYVGGRLVKPE
jgi:hypothetical protein